MKRAALLVLLLLAGCMTFEVKENHFFHPGPPQRATALAEPIELTTSDGVHLAGARIASPEADVDIVYFGGNVSRIDDYGDELARALSSLRANLYLFDYRGYGRSGGTPTIESSKSDALAIYDYVRRHAAQRPVVVHGFSLGSFMAGYVASQRPVDGLVLESTAPDVQRWATNGVPWYAKPFVRLKIAPALLAESNERVVRDYCGPLLLVTGSRDRVTPPKFSQALLAASASANKRVVIAQGADHGDAMMKPDAVRAYAAFVDSIRRR